MVMITQTEAFKRKDVSNNYNNIVTCSGVRIAQLPVLVEAGSTKEKDPPGVQV